MSDLHAQTSAAVASVLTEHGATAPDRDTDTLAGLIATEAIEAVKAYAITHDAEPDELASTPDAGSPASPDPADVADGDPSRTHWWER
jgi:hypothetical protein